MTGIPPRTLSTQKSWVEEEIPYAVLKLQFANGASDRVIAAFENAVVSALSTELLRRLRNIPAGRAFTRHRRTRFLNTALQATILKGSSRARLALLSEARDVVALEATHLARLGSTYLGVNWKTPAPSLVEAAIRSRPMLGHKFDKWFKNWIPSTAIRDVIARVNAGMIAGESAQDIVASVKDGALRKATQALRTLTHTTIGHTANQARQMTFERNLDVVPEVRWLATLDLRTSEICAALDGKQWKTDEPHPTPPQHPNCRSVLIPAIGPRLGQRAALGGRVSALVDFEEWLRTRTPADQDIVLGKTRGRLFREGRASLKDFVSDTFSRVLRLDELRALGILPPRG